MKKIWEEFKTFAVKGNAIDLAVGLVIGGGFGKIVTSLVNDIIMPPLGMVLGKMDFSDLVIHLSPPIEGVKPVTIRYGAFLNTVVDFFIVAIAIFLVVRSINKFRSDKPAPAPTLTKDCPQCASAISVKALRCPHCTSLLSN